MRFIYITLIIFLFCNFTNLNAQFTRKDTLSADPYDLWISADTGNLEMVKLCIEKGMYVDLAYQDNITPLMLATQSGHLEIVKYLVSKGANVNACSQYNETPILTAAVKNNDLNIAEYLIRHGSNINNVDVFGMQAIHYAALNSLYYMCDMLLYYDAELNKKDSSGNTPLFYAILGNDTLIIRLLLNHGVNLIYSESEPNHYLFTAADYNNLELVKFLHRKGLPLNVPNSSNLSIFDLFTINGNIEALQWLIQNGVNARDSITSYYNTRNLSLMSKNKSVKNLIRQTHIKPIYKPYFNKLGIGAGIAFNLNDIFFDFNSCLYDTRYGLQFSLGSKIRIGNKASWILYDNNVFYQIAEFRYGFYAGFYKHIRFPKKLNIPHKIFFGAEPMLLFSKSKSLPDRNHSVVVVSPKAGFILKIKNTVNIELSYSYIPLNVFNISPHRINIELSGLFNIKSDKSNYDNFYIIKE